MGNCAICTNNINTNQADVMIDYNLKNRITKNEMNLLKENFQNQKEDDQKSKLETQKSNVSKISKGKTISNIRKVKSFLKLPSIRENNVSHTKINGDKTAEQILFRFKHSSANLQNFSNLAFDKSKVNNNLSNTTIQQPKSLKKIQMTSNCATFKSISIKSNDLNANDSTMNSMNITNEMNTNDLINLNNNSFNSINLANGYSSFSGAGPNKSKINNQEISVIIEEKDYEGTVISGNEPGDLESKKQSVPSNSKIGIRPSNNSNTNSNCSLSNKNKDTNNNMNINIIDNNNANTNVQNSNSNRNNENQKCVDNNNFQYEEVEISNVAENKILNMLLNHYLFKHFDKKMIKIIIDNSQGFQIEKGCVIFREGDIGESFFIIQNGQVEISSTKSNEKKILGPGEGFGELALIYHTVKRDSTAIALTKLDFYLIFGNSYRQTSKNFSKNYIEQIIYLINGNMWFNNLEPVDKLNLASLIKYNTFIKKYILHSTMKNNSKLIDSIYLIKNGCLEIKIFDKITNKVNHFKLISKDSFGEKEVIMNLNNDNYNYEVESIEETTAFIITKEILIESLGKNYSEIILFSIFKKSISKNRFFKSILLKSYYKQIFELFEVKTYKDGDIIYNYKDINDIKKASIILEGSLLSSDDNKEIAEKGKIFGDEIINSKENILINNIIAKGFFNIVTLESQWTKIRDKLKILSKNSNLDMFKKANKLSKMYIFKHISDSKILEICTNFDKIIYKKNDVIIRENEDINYFYIITKGRVKVSKKGNFIRELEQGNCFGEIYLLNDEVSDVSITALNEVQCYTMKKKLFLNFLIDEGMNEFIKKKISLEDTNIELNDLYHIQILGKGRFGTVSLVHNQVSLYAIKTIPKEYINSNPQLCKYILEEKNVLLSLDYPLIVKLVKTLKHENLCFFLMEYINGKSVDDYINNKVINTKNVNVVRFFGACMAIILNYLNKKSIIHRDIKPANIIIDKSGYVKLLDFGTSKYIKDFTFTGLGTPTCTAPEVILGKGYSYPVDYWSIGVCMYFIYYGKYPFTSNTKDIQGIYNQILHSQPEFCTDKNNVELNDFIMAMLDKNPINRLCSLNIIEEHSFYKKFDWELLKQFKMEPPFVPEKNIIKDEEAFLGNTRMPFLNFITKHKFDLLNLENKDEEGEWMENNNNKYLNWFDEF